MPCVEVGDRNPLKAGAQIILHTSEKLPRVLTEVEPFTELRRDDQLKEPGVAGGLPGAQLFCRIDGVGCRRKPHFVRLSLPRRTLPGDVTAVSSPLSGDSVGRI